METDIMNRAEMADKIGQAIMESDLVENLAEVILRDALDTILWELAKLSGKTTLDSCDKEDYEDSLKTGKALLRSLRYFSTCTYPEKGDELKVYKKRYKELTKND
jgi:hypothetical protein